MLNSREMEKYNLAELQEHQFSYSQKVSPMPSSSSIHFLFNSIHSVHANYRSLHEAQHWDRECVNEELCPERATINHRSSLNAQPQILVSLEHL